MADCRMQIAESLEQACEVPADGQTGRPGGGPAGQMRPPVNEDLAGIRV
ncbi:MAG: hypothetical protein JSW71_10640 [Gemmatimonadota bacterium]|nr:MAG: hypothetical protein JSW71_10640 [Gemmatimonadota bacterium]